MRSEQKILRYYFLPRGRIAYLCVPDDLDAAERRRLIEHLWVDWVDGAAEAVIASGEGSSQDETH